MGSMLSGFFIPVEDMPHTTGGFFQLCTLGALYGYILCYASNMIKDGSELLLLVPALAGVVGSIVLPILGAVPDGAIVIFSGLGPNAQEEVSVGVGALAGSTIMLLTVPWLLAILAGRVNCVDGIPQYMKPKNWPSGIKWSKLSDPAAYRNTGVMCGPSIAKSAVIMLITLIPYIVIQVPAAMSNCVMEVDAGIKGRCVSSPLAALVGAILAAMLFIVYLVYQARTADDDPVKSDKIDELRLVAIRKHLVSIRGLFPDNFVDHEGTVPISPDNKRFQRYIRPFFKQFDTDNSGSIDGNELSLLLSRLGENPSREQVAALLKEADTDGDGVVSFDEFCGLVVKILNDTDFCVKTMGDSSRDAATATAVKSRSGEKTPLISSSTTGAPATNNTTKTSASVNVDGDLDEAANESEDDEQPEVPEDLAHLSPEEQQKRILFRSFVLMGLGVSTVLIFSDPMCDVLGAMGAHTGIKPFYISFILAPLVSNASELIAAYSYALKKTEKTITISFASLVGAACMNNTFCLSLFLFLVWARNLKWTFSAETISIIVVELVMFLFAIKRIHHWWYAIVVGLLFPASIVLVSGLEHFGLD